MVATLCDCSASDRLAADAGHDGGASRDAYAVDGASRDATAMDAAESTTRDGDAGQARDGSGDALVPTATSVSLSLPLVPPFSPSVHDYYVRCTAEMNPLVVTMNAAPGSTVALMQPTPTPPAVARSVLVNVAAGGAVVVGVTTGAVTEEYWVRCLPSDFAQLQLTLYPDAGTATPGYYLAGDIFSDDAVKGGYAMVLDGNGVPVWYRKTKDGDEAVDVDNLTPGVLSFTPYLNFTFADVASGQFELHDLAGGSTRYVASVGVPLDLHELRALPNGDSLVIAAPILTGIDLTGLGTLGPDENMLGCVIQEIDATGIVVWQWDVMDHFDAVQDSTYPIVKPVGMRPVVNPFHCNSVDVAPDGDLLVGARNMDSVFLISKATGAVLWKMGGATYTRDGARYIAVQGDPLTSFYRQHDVRFLPDGTISMFDDHTDRPGAARGVVYSYDVTAGVATMVWQYQGTQTSSAMGSFRVLPDGSRVIGWGSGTPGLAFTEVDEAGRDLLDFHFEDERWTYRAIKVPTAAFDIDVLRSTAGAP